jgi:hypothetical protein
MKGSERKNLWSLRLNTIFHDHTTNYLKVNLRGGRIYEYHDVPYELCEKLCHAKLKYRYYRRHVLNSRYPYNRIK